jgi:hypothetical protein
MFEIITLALMGALVTSGWLLGQREAASRMVEQRIPIRITRRRR